MKIRQKIDGPYIKLDQLLKLSGVVKTGGEVKNIILNKEIKVNDEICLSRGKKLYNLDVIKYKTTHIEVICDDE